MVLYNYSWINRTRQLNFSTLQNLARKGFAILVGLRCGLFSDLIVQLQALLRGVNEAETEKYGSAAIAAQMWQLAQGIRELAVSRPVTVFNGNCASSGSYAFYLVPTAAIGAIGYCYIWWKGLPASSVMYVTKLDMEKAVATVSNQLERVHESMSAIKRELTQKLENLNRKVVQQMETNIRMVNEINEVNLNLSQIMHDVQSMRQMLSGLRGKLDRLERKQDMINESLEYLCLEAGGFKYGHNARRFQDASDTVNHSEISYLDTKLKGLQVIAETKDSGVKGKSVITHGKMTSTNFPGGKVLKMKNIIHRSYPA